MRRDNQPLFGAIDGVPEGTWFRTRGDLMAAHVHRHKLFGIYWAGGGAPAESIVLSGGYEDDEDHGDRIVYTGMGGQKDGRQSADQELRLGNLALVRSMERRLPVRVVRGGRHRSRWSPPEGFRYAGLYFVTDAFYALGREGHRVWRFVLETPSEAVPGSAESPAHRALIELYAGACQVCGRVTRLRSGPSAVVVHLIPLHAPHDGADDWSNMVVVCPTHAAELAAGTTVIEGDLTLRGEKRSLVVAPQHQLDQGAVEYRRVHYVPIGLGLRPR